MASAIPELPVLARDQAFETLYRSYVKDVYHYALALLRNPADAEDVTQTTFLNAYRAFQRGEEIRKPQNWLIKIAHNVARTRYARASRRVKEVPLEDHVGQLAVPEDEKPNIEGVLHALGRLPFNQRAALVMRELEGRSYAEIADTLDVSVPAVETLIFRARKALRLRVSALRVLTAVPVPSSLTQLFESGVGGGSALVGTGFIVKAMIALVVGTVATGVGGDRNGAAKAAADPQGRSRAALVSVDGHGPLAKALSVKGAQGAAGSSARQGPSKRTHGTKIAAQVVAGKAVHRSSGRASAQAAASRPTERSSGTAPVSAAASNLVADVQETVVAVEGALPAVHPPSVPPAVAAALPPLPKLP